jgi:16S rRNA (guanine966-N2)-methyltransferase
MRIVAGQWKGRNLVAPQGRDTRPTSDRVREALFSSLTARLGTDLGGAVVLDLFAGTGALGLEALSRGASRAVLVEHDRGALKAIADNVAALGATDDVSVIAADALGPALTRAGRLGPFSLLFCDPPYRIVQARVAAALARLGRAGSIEFGAALVWEHAAGSRPPIPDGFARESDYRYGDTAVTLLRYYEEGRARAK